MNTQPATSKEKSATTESCVRVLVLVAAGTNCDRETMRAYREAGADPVRVHIRDLIDDPSMLDGFQIITIPGGFSYGDDLGAGRIFGNEIRFLIGESFQQFVEEGGLVLGICNGFQVLVRAGLLPGFRTQQKKQLVTLSDNDSGRFECRWTHLDVCSSNSEFVNGDQDSLFLPVAHAEGKFIPGDGPSNQKQKAARNEPNSLLQKLDERNQIVLRYTNPEGNQTSYPWNPNGSIQHVAAVSDPTGRILGMMPHPERFYEQVQHPFWQRETPTTQPDGLHLIQNGVEAVKQR